MKLHIPYHGSDVQINQHIIKINNYLLRASTHWCGLFLAILILAGGEISHHMKGLLLYTGRDDQRVKTFFMQRTGSRIRYLSLRK